MSQYYQTNSTVQEKKLLTFYFSNFFLYLASDGRVCGIRYVSQIFFCPSYP